MPVLVFIASILAGFYINQFITHPKTWINKNLPKIKIKFFQVSPYIKLIFREKTVHVHHWLYYSVVLVVTFTFVNGGFLDTTLSKGFLLGGIAQGISFPDWSQIVNNKS